MSNYISKTDWARIKQDTDSNVPIPYDPEDDPFDSNDPVSMANYFENATIEYRGKILQDKGKKLKTRAQVDAELL
jgi:hypothetical protein